MAYEDLILFLKENYGKVSYLEMSKKFDVPVHTVKRLSGEYIESDKKCGRGKSIFSRKQTTVTLNHECFSVLSLESCYWAGFIAADGYVTKNYLKIMLSSKGLNHLEKLKDFIKTSCKITVANRPYIALLPRGFKMAHVPGVASKQIMTDILIRSV